MLAWVPCWLGSPAGWQQGPAVAGNPRGGGAVRVLSSTQSHSPENPGGDPQEAPRLCLRPPAPPACMQLPSWAQRCVWAAWLQGGSPMTAVGRGLGRMCLRIAPYDKVLPRNLRAAKAKPFRSVGPLRSGRAAAGRWADLRSATRGRQRGCGLRARAAHQPGVRRAGLRSAKKTQAAVEFELQVNGAVCVNTDPRNLSVCRSFI